MARNESMLDAVATDLASWLDQTSTLIAAAMAPQGLAPFAAPLSEEQKLLYYKDALFNPDNTPNMQGRQQQIARMGPEAFTQVYRAVIKAYPALRVPAPPPGAALPAAPATIGGPEV